jgi:hypothetical protein
LAEGEKMKEIKFLKEFKQKIRLGSKTKTRRPLKPQPYNVECQEGWANCGKYEFPFGEIGDVINAVYSDGDTDEIRITDVRVERVQDISDDDVKAEGVKGERIGPCQNGMFYRLYRSCFGKIWDSIYGREIYCWNNNPYVWVIEFERIEP